MTTAGLMTAESHLAIESSSYLLTYLLSCSWTSQWCRCNIWH